MLKGIPREGTFITALETMTFENETQPFQIKDKAYIIWGVKERNGEVISSYFYGEETDEGTGKIYIDENSLEDYEELEHIDVPTAQIYIAKKTEASQTAEELEELLHFQNNIISKILSNRGDTKQ